MFSNEEKLFLEAISKMFSNNNEERTISQNNIQSWLQETYLQVLVSCNKFIISEELPSNIREYSCYLISLCTGKDHYQDWQTISLDIKTSVQKNALSLLGSKISSLRNLACITVASIFEVSVRDQGWPDLINILCNACNNDNIEFKISAINTLGMIWEKLPKEPFSFQEMSLMENTINNLLGNPSNSELAEKCLKSYQYFIDYIKEKFKDSNYLENALKLLINYCNGINNINTPEVAKLAIHRITQIVLLAYDYVQNNFRNLSEFFIELAKGESESLAIQALVFFTEVSYDEMDRKEKGLSYKNYMASIWNLLWPCFQLILDNGNKDDSDEYNRYKALSDLLGNLSILCDEKIIDDIFQYMGTKFNDNTSPLVISSAIYAFGSLMETEHVQKIESVIPSSLELMTKLFQKNDATLNFTLSWCFYRISEFHAGFILQNNNLLSFFINIIINLLKEQNFKNSIKRHLCGTILQLNTFISNNHFQSLNLLSPYLQDILITLEALAYLPSSYNVDDNLAESCFVALASLIEYAHEKDRMLISYFMEKVNIRLGEARDIKNFGGNKEKMYFYQSMLCQLVQSLCKNQVNNLIQLDYQKIENYFNIIESFFTMRSGVFKEGFLALSGLISLLKNNEADNLIERLMAYIKYSLNNYDDFENCKSACLSLTDCIQISKEKFYIYLKDLFPLFDAIIKADNVNKNIFSFIIIVYSDLFGYIGQKIWDFYQSPFEFMRQIMEYSLQNQEKFLSNKIEKEEFDYYIKLNESVVDFVQSIEELLKNSDENKKEAFKEYIPDIMDYIQNMIDNQMFNPSNDYLNSIITFLIDFLEIYHKYAFKKLNEFTWKRIFQLANNTNNDNIINLKDYLQITIFSIKMKS